MFWSSSKPVAENTTPSHPYFPVGVEIVNYVANDKDFVTLVSTFAAGCAVILGLSWLAVAKFYPRVRRQDKWIILWFILTGSIHFWFEGYFAFNHTRMAPAQDLFGQLWKEYSYSDSRYLWSEPFVVTMETITAVLWGPLSYLTAYMIVTNHPFRYPIQAIVSVGQLYGDILYYATSMFQSYYKDVTYCRPEAYYFWFYFVFMNLIWIVIPGLLLFQSVKQTGQAFKSLDRLSKTLQGNGAVKRPQVQGHLKRT